MHKKEALWRVVLDSNYGSSWGGWYSNEVHELGCIGWVIDEY
jgi:hypothetical protein